MSEFVVPKTNSKNPGRVDLIFSFSLLARYDAPLRSRTVIGSRVYQRIVSGELTGERITATVHPDSGGNYDLLRADGIREIFGVFMIKAANGEWIYVEQAGVRRPDGDYKLIAYIDAASEGAYAWLNNTTFAVTAKEARGGQEIAFSYYAAD